MVDKSINHSLKFDDFDKFIREESHNLPGWITKERVHALKTLDSFESSLMKSSTWKNKKLDFMINNFFEKEFKEKRSSKSLIKNKLIDKTEYFTDSIRIYFYGGVFFSDEELPNYISFLRQEYSEKHKSIFSLSNRSDRQALPCLLNNIISKDALIIKTKKNQNIENLIHIIHLPHHNLNVAPRINIKLAENSSMKILEEQYQSNKSIINNLIDIKCDTNASLELYKINHAQQDSFHIDNSYIDQNQNSKVKIFNLDLGGDSANSLINIKLNGENSEGACSTLFMPTENRSSHQNIVIDHLSDKTSSSVNFRGVINDDALGSFYGKVRVAKERKQTLAFMQNKNLLLTDNAKISTIPILEIYNDDTECSHSATSGSLDKEKLFYLKTRGINEDDAKDFLIKSFIDELASQIKSRRLRDYVNEIIAGNYKV